MGVTSEEYRRIMGSFATGVTIVTTAHDGELAGMTANAVSSVSLEPIMLLFCADKKSRTHDVIDAGGVFAVNLLTQEMQELSNRFARPGMSQDQQFGDVQYTSATTGSPILEGNMGWFDCRVVHRHAGGDHTIFVGEVVDAQYADGEPLIYYRGSYNRLAQ